jgi:hypothetical protein
MSPATLQRCFEPFFTTKQQQGTGMGLAMVYGPVCRHNRTIEVESEEGVGTSFRLAFPFYAESTTMLPSDASVPPVVRLNILVADNNPARGTKTRYRRTLFRPRRIERDLSGIVSVLHGVSHPGNETMER